MHYKLCGHKYLTYKVLTEHGIRNVPKHKMYHFGNINESIDDFAAWKCPVVIKPCEGTSGGEGVTVNIRTVKDLKNAIAESFVFDRRAYLMEEYVEGSHFRLTTLRGRLVACTQRMPPTIIGNGRSSVGELIEAVNRARSRDTSDKALSPITVDNEVKRKLASMGKSMSSVLKKDEEIQVKDTANLSSGAHVIWVDNVSEEVKATCREVATVLDIYLCGCDIITTDITKSLNDTNGVINEVNTSPGIAGIYEVSNCDTPVDIAEIVLKDMFEL